MGLQLWAPSFGRFLFSEFAAFITLFLLLQTICKDVYECSAMALVSRSRPGVLNLMRSVQPEPCAVFGGAGFTLVEVRWERAGGLPVSPVQASQAGLPVALTC